MDSLNKRYNNRLFRVGDWHLDVASHFFARLLQRQIDATDRQIDRLVYERYPLTTLRELPLIRQNAILFRNVEGGNLLWGGDNGVLAFFVPRRKRAAEAPLLNGLSPRFSTKPADRV